MNSVTTNSSNITCRLEPVASGQNYVIYSWIFYGEDPPSTTGNLVPRPKPVPDLRAAFAREIPCEVVDED